MKKSISKDGIEYHDYPLQECADTAQKLIKDGATVLQKFTCQHCKTRQTIPDPNVFYTKGKCEECSQITDIEKHGCNYLLMTTI